MEESSARTQEYSAHSPITFGSGANSDVDREIVWNSNGCSQFDDKRNNEKKNNDSNNNNENDNKEEDENNKTKNKKKSPPHNHHSFDPAKEYRKQWQVR